MTGDPSVFHTQLKFNQLYPVAAMSVMQLELKPESQLWAALLRRLEYPDMLFFVST